ncbi:MAG: translation elongation factor Ts [Myxococcales bacterium 68-20]|nr:translation elongation factor Ts [Myxococcales bacterium]OJY31117.1 MAG: translation elongation factor Ts [Myxococcales bacterium 68-20]
MAAVTPALIKELRDRTSAGMSDCKNALVEAEGDLEKAVEVILKKGIVKAASRAGKVAAEGEVATWVSADGKKGVIVEVNCQTDFVARGDDFKKFVNDVVSVAQNLAKGKDLGAEKYPGSDKSIDEIRQELVGRIGENIVVRRWDSLEATGDNGVVQAYVHMGGKLAVLLAAQAPSADKKSDGDFKAFVENCAMQVAAMSPIVVDKSQVDAAAIAKQKDIYSAQLKEELDNAVARIAELKAGGHDLNEKDLAAELKAAEQKKGPPEAMWPKVVEGKISKWYTEVTLLGQDNVWEPGAGSIDKVRGELSKRLGGDVKLDTFLRFGLGEGIEKKTEDLAAEVAKTIGN